LNPEIINATLFAALSINTATIAAGVVLQNHPFSTPQYDAPIPVVAFRRTRVSLIVSGAIAQPSH
jgi:hypothetical protein